MGFRVFKIPTNTKPDIVCPIKKLLYLFKHYIVKKYRFLKFHIVFNISVKSREYLRKIRYNHVSTSSFSKINECNV